jgi:hypothetical protein
VTAATSTTLTVTGLSGLVGGNLNASVSVDGFSSGAAVQVATVTPVVTLNTATLASNATSITIAGIGFDPTAAHNTVAFNDGAVGSVTAATATSLTVTFSTRPTGAGSLTAVVTTNGAGSGAAVQVATVSVAFGWNGSQSSDWFNALNWTDANVATHHAVPGAADTAVIVSATNNPVLNANATVAGLQLSSGSLTLNANLTDTGDLSQGGATVAFGADTNLLTVDGNFTHTGGGFQVSHGTVVLAGTSAQTLTDTAGLSLPNLSVTGTGGVTIASGSAVVVTGLSVSANLTLNANLTATGAFSQSGGTVTLNSNQLRVAGNVTRTGGTFPGTTGAVALNGTAGQSYLDTTFNKLPGLIISNTSAAGVSLPGGSNVGVRTGGSGVTLDAGATLTLMQGTAASFLIDRGNFTDNGKIVLSQLSPNGGSSTALITINGTLALSGTATFDLTVGGNLAPGAAYTFVTYGSTTGTAGTTTVHGNFPFAAAPAFGATALTVTLTSLGTIDTWTGAVSNDWFTAANWTATDGSHVVPGAQDLAIIAGAPFATVLNANATVAGVQFSNGFLTLNANLTVTGTFNPDTGFLAFGSNANQLILQGNVTRKSGTFLGTAGTVVFAGASQSVTDTSGRAFGWNMVINSGSAVTVQPGSVVTMANNFTNNGTVNLSMSAPTSATPLVIGNNLVEGTGSVFNLTLGNTNAGLVYIFIMFGGTETLGATFNANAGTVNHNAHNITVTT